MSPAKIGTLTKSGGKSADLCRPKKRKQTSFGWFCIYGNGASMDHGMVLTDEQIKYDDLTEYGTVTISYEAGQIRVVVDGFEFAEPESCRLHATKAIHWARDVLSRQIEAEKLAPGGNIMCAVV